MGGGLVEVLDKWAVEVLVLFSFTLQVFLLIGGGIRRRSVSVAPRVLLWLSYQLADAAALYTLGHLSMSRRPKEQLLLVAFWAPFLLVHLGGQDTITAYAFEDNRLWLRHLQTLLVQVAGAAYVLYKYIPGSEAPVMAAALLMFVVGVLKYGERIWALKCASIDSIWSSLKAQKDGGDRRPLSGGGQLQQELDEEAAVRRGLDLDPEEKVLMGAHYLLHVCKGLFVGLRRGESEDVKHALQLFRDSHGKLMVTELSLMYDIMYTKAAVIHTWYGCCIRATSLVATATALLLFQFSAARRRGRYQTSDIAVTYVLLAGALLLETASSLWAAASTWTLEFLRARNWRRLRGAVQCLRRLARAPSYRKWSGSVGQYNLFLTCAREGREEERRLAKVAGMVGLEGWWNELHRAGSTTVPESTMELLLGEIFQMGDMQIMKDGFFRFSRDMIRHHQGYRLDEKAGFNVEDFDLEGSILEWHVVTEICLFEDYLKIKEEDRGKCEPLVSAIKLLSNYMMFLLVVRPYMLPGAVLYSRYVQTFDYLRDLMRQQPVAAGDSTAAQDRLKSVLRDECAKLFTPPFDYSSPRPPPYLNGVGLAMTLLAFSGTHAPEMLQQLFRVWVEMLSFVGDNCNREAHARELCSGGELVTIVWLMRGHAKLCSQALVMDADSRPAEEDEGHEVKLPWSLYGGGNGDDDHDHEDGGDKEDEEEL